MHLYLHIPFCHRICPYCAFVKHTPANTNMKQFIDALLIEAHARKEHLQFSSQQANTIYFGGGTPSMLSNSHLSRLIEGLNEIIPVHKIDEFTFESNPATFTNKKVERWKELGINRVSLGIQSFDPHILTILGREHSPQDAKDSIQLLRDAGMPQVNIDLMFSIPGQTLDSWKHTLEETLSLSPEHISAYNLTYEEDTAFFESLQLGAMDRDEDRDAQFFTITHDLLTQAGMRHYETSNFAKEPHLSEHNLSYWKGEDYVGIGPGAVGTIQGMRYQNTSDTEAYIESTLQNGIPTYTHESLSEEDFRLERIALLLRTDLGLPTDYISESNTPLLDQLSNEKLIQVQNDRIILSNQGRLVVDSIAGYLC